MTGTGIDIVEIERFTRLMARYGDRFLARHFDADEIAYCRSKARPEKHFAGRFAAKEAVLKALALAWGPGFDWKNISIRNGPDAAPLVTLSGEFQRRAAERGVEGIHVSISHCDAYSVAVAVAVGR